MDARRLFFGVEVSAPWPEEYPRGRLLDPEQRHMTLAFLGNVDYQKVQPLLTQIPKPTWQIGIPAFFDAPLFLPPHRKLPKVHAWHVQWLADDKGLLHFQRQLSSFLIKNEFKLDERDFLPHVTICRAPFYPREWKRSFVKLPCFFKDIHLYESVGNLKYEARWTASVSAPFEEVEHTADIAFKVRGESLGQLFQHAFLALSFRFPELLQYIPKISSVTSLHDIVKGLNDIVCLADAEIGCPFKAISYHGNLLERPEKTFEWEMIVDV